jgi:enoyl-CoA hydratase
MTERIVREDRGGVRVVRMRFGRANALGPEVIEELSAVLSTGNAPTVLTGNGAVFSAGLDLLSLEPLDRPDMERLLERFSALLMRALTLPTPLVAAVNGHCVAGGCILAMACDHRVGRAGSFKIGINELALGLTLPALPFEILHGKLTPREARRVILGAGLFTPDEAIAHGLLDEVEADVETSIERACEVAGDLGRSPAEFAHLKGLLVAPISERFRLNRATVDRRFLDTWFSASGIRLRTAAVERLRSRGSAK